MTIQTLIEYVDHLAETMAERHNNFFGYVEGHVTKDDVYKSKEGQQLAAIISALSRLERLEKVGQVTGDDK